MEKRIPISSLESKVDQNGEEKHIITIIPRGKGETPIEIYEPTQKQKLKIIELIRKDLVVDEKGMQTKISKKDVFLEILTELSNIYIDRENEEQVNNAVNNPDDYLIEAMLEAERIAMKTFKLWYKSGRNIAELPEEIQEEMIELDSMIAKNEEKLAKEKEKEELRKQIEEQKRKLAELENEQE